MLLQLIDVLGLQLDLAAAGGDSGVVVAVQIEQLGRIVVPIADYEMSGRDRFWRRATMTGSYRAIHRSRWLPTI